jgi:transcription elongation factor GreA
MWRFARVALRHDLTPVARGGIDGAGMPARDDGNLNGMEKIPMTAAGYAALEIELKRLRSVERPRIIQAIAEARTHGDLSENAEYHAAKEQHGLNEARVAELEEKLGRAEIIDPSKLDGERVMFGATVTLVDEDTEEKKVYQIVGDFEADVKDGKISISSPISRSLIGKTVGDTVEVNTPGGGKSYEILKVRFR